jgi:hypothetical protein
MLITIVGVCIGPLFSNTPIVSLIGWGIAIVAIGLWLKHLFG